MSGGYYITMTIPENTSRLSIVQGDLVRFLLGPFPTFDAANTVGPAVVEKIKNEYPGDSRNHFDVAFYQSSWMPRGAFNKFFNLSYGLV